MSIYLDYNSTTMMVNEVKAAIAALSGKPLNPSSIHSFGRQAKGLIEKAREEVMSLVGLNMHKGDYSLIFTSSGTEANNLIIHNFSQGRVLISSTEHISILKHKEYHNNIDLLAVDENGIVRMDQLESWLEKNTGASNLVSIIFANNETGIIQPIKEIAALVHKYGALIHSDIVQAPGKIEIDLEDLDLDFATLSGHKFGGPIGAAGLLHKTKHHIKAQLLGGGQEKSSRSGTENVQAIVGFGVAALKAKAELASNYAHMNDLKNLLEKELGAIVIGQNTLRLPNTSMIVMPGIKASQQLIAFDMRGFAISTGAACSSGKVKASHVLKAMNFDDDLAECAIRVSLGPSNDKEDVYRFVEVWKEISQQN